MGFLSSLLGKKEHKPEQLAEEVYHAVTDFSVRWLDTVKNEIQTQLRIYPLFDDEFTLKFRSLFFALSADAIAGSGALTGERLEQFLRSYFAWYSVGKDREHVEQTMIHYMEQAKSGDVAKYFCADVSSGHHVSYTKDGRKGSPDPKESKEIAAIFDTRVHADVGEVRVVAERLLH